MHTGRYFPVINRTSWNERSKRLTTQTLINERFCRWKLACRKTEYRLCSNDSFELILHVNAHLEPGFILHFIHLSHSWLTTDIDIVWRNPKDVNGGRPLIWKLLPVWSEEWSDSDLMKFDILNQMWLSDYNKNKKAVLSQRWPRDARYISRSWAVAEIWPFEIIQDVGGRHLEFIRIENSAYFAQSSNACRLRRYRHLKFFQHGGGRHLGIVRIVNSAVRSTVPENPTLEPNMKWIGSPVAEIWLFADLVLFISGHWRLFVLVSSFSYFSGYMR